MNANDNGPDMRRIGFIVEVSGLQPKDQELLFAAAPLLPVCDASTETPPVPLTPSARKLLSVFQPGVERPFGNVE